MKRPVIIRTKLEILDIRDIITCG